MENLVTQNVMHASLCHTNSMGADGEKLGGGGGERGTGQVRGTGGQE